MKRQRTGRRKAPSSAWPAATQRTQMCMLRRTFWPRGTRPGQRNKSLCPMPVEERSDAQRPQGRGVQLRRSRNPLRRPAVRSTAGSVGISLLPAQAVATGQGGRGCQGHGHDQRPPRKGHCAFSGHGEDRPPEGLGDEAGTADAAVHNEAGRRARCASLNCFQSSEKKKACLRRLFLSSDPKGVCTRSLAAHGVILLPPRRQF